MDQLEAQLSEDWMWYMDFVPIGGATLSLVCSIYVVGSNCVKNDEDTSLLEEVFSFASMARSAPRCWSAL